MASNAREIGEYTRLVVDEIRAERARKRMTQKELAAASGIPLGTLSHIEQGQAVLDVEQMGAIAKGLKVDLVALLAAAGARRRNS
jgi:transcriptional regulator with XRE-family HTH domain